MGTKMKIQILISAFIFSFSTSHSFAKPPEDRIDQIRGRVARPVRPGTQPTGPGASLGLPVHQGNGCPAGTVSATLSPDNQLLSVLFDQFAAKTSPTAKMDIKTCRLRIPISVAAGYQVMITKTDWRGFNALPPGVTAQVASTHSLWTTMNMIDRSPFTQTLNFSGPTYEDFLISNELTRDLVWSPCGQTVVVNIGASIRLDQGSATEDASATIDSLDVANEARGIKYRLTWRQCQ
jgi:hypothetical protein